MVISLFPKYKPGFLSTRYSVCSCGHMKVGCLIDLSTLFLPGTTTDGPTKRDPAVIPVYQEVWFIALIAIIALFMLFLLIACCLRTSGRRVPYIRERMPLQPRQRKAAPLAYCIDPYDGSIITTVGNLISPHSHL